MPDSSLLIGPYWNWNVEGATLTKISYALNWTLLELKHISFASSVYSLCLLIGPYWNWNLDGNLHKMFWESPLNWTLLELKPKGAKRFKHCTKLLIGPYWNWNLSIIPDFGKIFELLIGPYWNWNSNSAVKDWLS